MHTPGSKWDIERAAAWLRRHAWGEGGQTPPAPVRLAAPLPLAASLPPVPPVAPVALAAPAAPVPLVALAPPAPPAEGASPEPDDDFDIAGWPALVAPFYD